MVKGCATGTGLAARLKRRKVNDKKSTLPLPMPPLPKK